MWMDRGGVVVGRIVVCVVVGGGVERMQWMHLARLRGAKFL